jgi:hypothetical protein
VPKQHINKTDKNKTDYSKTEKSQSVTWRFPDSPERGCFDGQTDGGLQVILENCELKYFDADHISGRHRAALVLRRWKFCPVAKRTPISVCPAQSRMKDITAACNHNFRGQRQG